MLEEVLPTGSMDVLPHIAEQPPKLHLLVVDSDAAVRSACGEIAASFGYAVESVSSFGEAREMLRGQAADILLVNLPWGNHQGVDLIAEVHLLYPQLAIIAMTASSSVGSAVEAMRCGASDYLTKPFAVDELSTVLERAASSRHADFATRQLREQLRLSHGPGAMIGHSAEMEKLYRILSKVAQTSHPVLILGESGTGKELVARTIHGYGPNAQKPFLPVDCGSGADPDRKRIVRLCQRSVHWRKPLQGWAAGFGGGRHGFPRRNRRAFPRPAIKAPARPAGKRSSPRGSHASHPHQGSNRGGHQSRPQPDGRKGHLPQGPVLPPQCCQSQASSPARPPRRYSLARRALPRAHQPRARHQVHAQR